MLRLLENSESDELQDLLYEKVGELFSSPQTDDEVAAYRDVYHSRGVTLSLLTDCWQDVLPQLQPALPGGVSEGGEGRHLGRDDGSLHLDCRAESGPLAGLPASPPLWQDCPRAGGGGWPHGHLCSQEVERRDKALHLH